MDYKEHIRKKDGGLQAILSYKEGKKWKQKSKQGFEDSRKGKKEAKEWLRKALDELENNLKLDRDHADITFKEYTDMYLEDRKVNISVNTYVSFRAAFKKFSSLNDIPLKNITTMDIQRCVNNMQKDTTGTTVRSYIKSLKTAFNYAVNKYSILKESPVKNLEYKINKSKDKIALSVNEANRLIQAFKNQKGKYYVMTILALKTGLRIGEIMGLTWDRIDFNSNMIKIDRQWNKISTGNGFTKLKSKNSYRYVPFNSFVRNELIEYRNSYPIGIDNRLFNINSTKNAATKLAKLYNKLGFNISVHELRHTYATNLIANGIDFKTAAALLGHDVEQTMKTYSHVTVDMMEAAKKIINNI